MPKEFQNGKCQCCGQNLRSKSYNDWRRSISDKLLNLTGFKCYHDDGDIFEKRFRNGKLEVVAYFETITVFKGTITDFRSLYHREARWMQTTDNKNRYEWTHYYIGDKNFNPWQGKKVLGVKIHDDMKIPAYIVWHRAECMEWLVIEIKDFLLDRPPVPMTQEGYIHLLATV